jgi:hypothetical protein
VLKYAVQTHGDEEWVAIYVHVPDRTRKQCYDRWPFKKHMDPNCRAVREKYHGALKKAPALGQAPQFP